MDDRRPRLGFLGLGWIGRQRMEAMVQAGAGSVGAVADLDVDAARAAAAAVDCPVVCRDLDEMLAESLDGVVIATPTALHAPGVRRVLEAGLPVFCQKPLGRTAAECRELVELARSADLPLGVDMSYRHAEAVQAAVDALRDGEIGPPHAAELVFHNAYGPDKAWVRDPALAGGGALIDLGCHLLDLARVFLGPLEVEAVHADLFADGGLVSAGSDTVEDLALAQVRLTGGRTLRLACSWWLPAGVDAVIEASFISPGRSLRIRNVDGSFYDFETLLVIGRQARRIAAPPDDWGGRALISWAARLADGRRFDPGVEVLVEVAALIDRIYGRPA